MNDAVNYLCVCVCTVHTPFSLMSRSSGWWHRVVMWVGYQRFGGPCYLRNVSILPRHYTVSQLKRQRLESSPL